MADFPTAISTWTNKTDGVDYPEADDVNQPNNEVIAIQTYLIETASEVTVSGGVLTVTKSRHTVQPQSGTSDDIDTITGIPDGGELILSVSDLGTDELVFKHGTGNLSLPAETDITLTTGAVRFYRKGSTVYAQGGGGEPAATGGDITPYRISVTVASNNITVALKNKDGDDPTVDSPVKVQIGDTVREVTSALSVTKNAGTNWCNSGSAELATKEVDYFAYLGYNATNGVVIGFSRIPFARIYSDFSTTTTNEKYAAISTITNAASSDAYAVIGRFAATLSAGAGYTWSVPTFTAANLVHNPIHTSRPLSYVPQFTNLTVGNGTLAAFYQIACERVYRIVQLTFGSTTSISGAVSYTLPFTVNASIYSVTSANNAARFFDASPAGSYAGLSYIATNSVTLVAQNAAGTYLIVAGLSSTVPFTWTTSDAISDSGWIII